MFQKNHKQKIDQKIKKYKNKQINKTGQSISGDQSFSCFLLLCPCCIPVINSKDKLHSPQTTRRLPETEPEKLLTLNYHAKLSNTRGRGGISSGWEGGGEGGSIFSKGYWLPRHLETDWIKPGWDIFGL